MTNPSLSLLLVTFVLFLICMASMAIGLLIRGKIMRGGCGSNTDKNGQVVPCESCSKKTLNLCDEEASAPLADASFAATLGRFKRNKD